MDKYQILTLLIAALGGVPGIILIIKAIYKTSIKVTFDEGQSFICPIDSDNDKINNQCCFGFYKLFLVGHGDKPTTPKAITFSIRKGCQWVEGSRIILKTHKIKDVDSCAILSNGIDTIVIMNWCEFAASEDALKHGEPLTKSVAFCFALTLDEIRKCKYMRFVIEDYFEKTYKSKVRIKPELYKSIEKNFKIIDKERLPSNLLQTIVG